MKRKIIAPALFTGLGTVIFLFAAWWSGQTGYYNPDPAKRDANIGAGLLGIVAFITAVCGFAWLVTVLLKNKKEH